MHEFNLQELHIIDRWIVAPASQDSENLASKSLETNRIPDPYIFLGSNGKLLTPSEKTPIESTILRRNYIEEAEYRAFLKIQDFVDKNDEGSVFWFSPQSEGGYLTSKIIASQILFDQSGQKLLFNRAIVLDVDGQTSMEIANLISNTKYSDPEQLREDPIFVHNMNSHVWIDVLSKFTNQTSFILSSEDISIKNKALKRTNRIFMHTSSPYLAEMEARKRGMIGDKPDSCATSSGSAFNTFFENSLKENFFECPKCHGLIPSGQGITTCPHCGLTKEQAGSTCG